MNAHGCKRDKSKKELKTAAVLFVENTKDGELAKELREVMGRIEDILGYKVKIVERSGTPLKLMFPLSRIGEGQACSRGDCVTCTQDSRGEVLPPCTKRSVLYENICVTCNPDILEDNGNKKKSVSCREDPPSVYIGETSKSLYERGREHWRDFRTKEEDSHIYKHQMLHHGGQEDANFHLRPIKFFRTALTRQLSEAVRIHRLGEEVVLNSKSEYNRCKISRLTLGEDNMVKDKMKASQAEKEDGDAETEDRVRKWTQQRTVLRRADEVGQTLNLERGLVRSPAQKRTENLDEDNNTTPSSGRKKSRTTKRKYPLLDSNWGLGGEDKQPPPSSLESSPHHPPPYTPEDNATLPPPPPSPTTTNEVTDPPLQPYPVPPTYVAGQDKPKPTPPHPDQNIPPPTIPDTQIHPL